ncbi:hypothetical protein R6Z07F_020010 [Ovis aries]
MLVIQGPEKNAEELPQFYGYLLMVGEVYRQINVPKRATPDLPYQFISPSDNEIGLGSTAARHPERQRWGLSLWLLAAAASPSQRLRGLLQGSREVTAATPLPPLPRAPARRGPGHSTDAAILLQRLQPTQNAPRSRKPPRCGQVPGGGASLEAGGSVYFSEETIKGAQPLWAASAADHLDLVQSLLCCEDLESSTTCTLSKPLRTACFDGQLDVERYSEDSLTPSGQGGLDFRVNPDSWDFDNNTPVHIAKQNNCLEIVNALTEAGTHVDTTSAFKNTACKVSVSFEDMTVDFSREEWQDLDSAQRFLYQDMMPKTTATSSHWGGVAARGPCTEVPVPGCDTGDLQPPVHSGVLCAMKRLPGTRGILRWLQPFPRSRCEGEAAAARSQRLSLLTDGEQQWTRGRFPCRREI